jgi:hypothetical protein
MNSIDIISVIFERFFPLILIILIFLSILALRSIWPRSIPSIESFYSFKKGKTEYFELSRPHSNIFHDYLKLALMTTGHRQQEFVQLVSSMIKEHLETKTALSGIKYSDSLSHLILDPKSWLKSRLNMIEISNKQKKDFIFEFLFQQYAEIFTELEDLLDLNLLTELK